MNKSRLFFGDSTTLMNSGLIGWPLGKGLFILRKGRVFTRKEMTVPTPPFEFSKLVFGTWRLADKYSNDPKDVLVRMKACISRGITCFDLADIYGGYQYEELFGKALALDPSLRDQMSLVTKCNIQYPVGEGRPGVTSHYYDTSKDYILGCVDRSLAKIGTKQLEVLLLHRPDPLMDADEVALAFQQLRSEKKVRVAFSLGVALWSLKFHPIAI